MLFSYLATPLYNLSFIFILYFKGYFSVAGSVKTPHMSLERPRSRTQAQVCPLRAPPAENTSCTGGRRTRGPCTLTIRSPKRPERHKLHPKKRLSFQVEIICHVRKAQRHKKEDMYIQTRSHNLTGESQLARQELLHSIPYFTAWP